MRVQASQSSRFRRSGSSNRASVVADAWCQLLAGFDAHGQPILLGRQWTGVIGREHAGGVIGEVEVERVGAILLGLEVEVAPGFVGLVPRRRVEDRYEER